MATTNKGARREPTANVLVHEGTSAGIDAADSPVPWSLGLLLIRISGAVSHYNIEHAQVVSNVQPKRARERYIALSAGLESVLTIQK